MLTTEQRGSVAEAEVVAAAAKLGIGVAKPLTNAERYDLIFDLRTRLIRVQCKSASSDGDVVDVRCRRCRRTAHGQLHRGYSPDEVDAFAVYCQEIDRCFFLPIDLCAGRNQIFLRLKPTKNRQSVGVNWADDFDFAATLVRLGAVAQLGERERGTLEVTGSSPVGSTSELRNSRSSFCEPQAIRRLPTSVPHSRGETDPGGGP